MIQFLVFLLFICMFGVFGLLGLAYLDDKKAKTYSWVFCFAVSGFSLVEAVTMWTPAIKSIGIL